MTGLPFIPTSPEQRMALIAWGREREAQGMERAAKIAVTHGGPVKWASENSDRYHIQAEWAQSIAAAIRAAIRQQEKL